MQSVVLAFFDDNSYHLSMKRFIGRQKEIGILRQSIRDGVKGIMVYGQRQVGKTSLIDEAFSTDEFVLVRHECVKGSYEYNVELLALSVANATGIGFAKDSRDVFNLLSIMEMSGSGKPIVVVLDEYQYLRQTQDDGVIDSYMQRFIDSITGNVTLVLCGSYVTVMQELLEYGNPLFSRLKTIVRLTTFDYLESSLFYPDLCVRDKIAFYAVFGGYPFVLENVDQTLSLEENIKNLMLNPYSSLRMTIESVLLQEIGKTGMPYEVLSKIGNSKLRYHELQSLMAGDVTGTLDRILKRLVEMGIIEKVSPINRKDDKRKTFYEIRDNLLRFHFTYIYPMRALPTRLEGDVLYDKFIAPSLNTWISKRFEVQVCEYFAHMQDASLEAVGSYWYDDPSSRKNGEFDCALKRNGRYSLYEVKYLSRPMTYQLYEEERAKMEKVEYIDVASLGFVSSSGFDFTPPSDGEFITGEMLYDLPV